jgi:precorrin-6B methylase 2
MEIILKEFLIYDSIFFILLLWLIYTRSRGAEYAPTTRSKAKKMLEFANINKNDVVYDLGSGLGGITIRAAKKAKKAIGIEYDHLRYIIGRLRAILTRYKNIKFIRGDLFEQDFNDADVVFIFLKQKTNQKLKSKLAKLKKGARIVSNRWTIENWKAVKMDEKLKIYLYIIGKSDKYGHG